MSFNTIVTAHSNSILTRGGYSLRPRLDPNPLRLPAYTAMFQFLDLSYDPREHGAHYDEFYHEYRWKPGSTWIRVSSEPNVWTYHRARSDWSLEFNRSNGQFIGRVRLLGANTSGVTDMRKMFNGDKMDSIVLFDTSAVTDLRETFSGTGTLVPVYHYPLDNPYMHWSPNFDLSEAVRLDSMFYACDLVETPRVVAPKATSAMGMFQAYYGTSDTNAMTLEVINDMDLPVVDDVSYMFHGQRRVRTGALALYRKLSTQAHVPANHASCFDYCGSLTPTGLAELQQIPTSWGGLKEE